MRITTMVGGPPFYEVVWLGTFYETIIFSDVMDVHGCCVFNQIDCLRPRRDRNENTAPRSIVAAMVATPNGDQAAAVAYPPHASVLYVLFPNAIHLIQQITISVGAIQVLVCLENNWVEDGGSPSATIDTLDASLVAKSRASAKVKERPERHAILHAINVFTLDPGTCIHYTCLIPYNAFCYWMGTPCLLSGRFAAGIPPAGYLINLIFCTTSKSRRGEV